jgi:hypothetical protein
VLGFVRASVRARTGGCGSGSSLSEVGAVIDDASHFLKCVFYISIRVLELKKGEKELNNLAHLKTKILNIKNRSKWSLVLTVLHFSKYFSCLSQPL